MCIIMQVIPKDRMFYRFALYGFLKNVRLFDIFILLFLKASGLTYTEIGILYAIREVSINLLEIPTGIFADAYGRRKSMVMSMLSYIFSFSIFYLTSSFVFFAAAMVLFGLGEAYRTGTHKAMILEYLKRKGILDKKVEYYGATRSFSQLGSAINSLLAAAVVFYTGNFRDIFLVTLIPYFINLVNLATYPSYLDGEISRKKRKKRVHATLGNFAGIFKNRPALRAMLNSSTFDAAFKATKDYLQRILEIFALSLPVLLFLNGDQRTAMVIGVTYFFVYLLSSFASRYSYVIVDKIGKLTRAINLTTILGGLALLFTGLAFQFSLDLLSISLFLMLYVLHNMRRPMTVGYISEKIKSKVMASGLSAESQLKTIFAAVFSVIMGYLADALGVSLALASIGIILLIIAPAVFVRE